MLTKEIKKNVRKSKKARAEYDFVLSDIYQQLAIELIKRHKKPVTEAEFEEVFENAVVTSKLLYWLIMQAKDQWKAE